MHKSLFHTPQAWTIIIYSVIVCLIIGLINLFYIPNLLNEAHFLNWDAEHYFWIKENGYEGFRVAFFPFFPLLWRMLSCSIFGIVLVNALVFLISFYFIVKSLNTSTFETLLYLSIPSCIFFFLPYTESFYFAFSTVIIYGIRKEKRVLVWIGIFLCVLTRPSFIFIVPALILTDLYYKKLNLKLILMLALYVFIALFGLTFVFSVHFYYTGNWFSYFEMSKGWGGVFHFLKLPFTSWGGDLIARFDGVSMLFGIFSGLLLFFIFLKTPYSKRHLIAKEVVFSLIYLFGVTVFIILRGGMLFSLNRFIFASPFIIIGVNFWLNQTSFIKGKQLLYIFGFICLFWLLFGSYVHIQTFIKYFLLSIYVVLIFVVKLENKSIRKLALCLLIVLNVIFQLIFYIRFLSGNWVG